MSRIIAIILICLFPCTCYAEGTLDFQGVLAVAKITGACGIMDEMISFQKKTKIAGGNDFVVRFWQAESSRQGKTVKQMSDDCDKAIFAYDNLWKSMEPKNSN